MRKYNGTPKQPPKNRYVIWVKDEQGLHLAYKVRGDSKSGAWYSANLSKAKEHRAKAAAVYKNCPVIIHDLITGRQATEDYLIQQEGTP